MKKALTLILLSLSVVTCTKISDEPLTSFLTGSGAFILNEGNFKSGNGSLSYYSNDSLKIYNDLFNSINNRPLGDVPNSMVIHGEKAFIVVNNSGKIEVVNKNTIESISTISGLVSPRNMSIINDNKAYVTSMYSNSVTVLNLNNYSISGYINIGKTSEAVVVSNGKAFISNYIGGNKIMVINTSNDKVVDSIQVGVEPETMVIDKNKQLWILCNGGYLRNNFAELIAINTTNYAINKKFVFPTKQASPTCLQIDGTSETLYYLDGGVRRMSINASDLPTVPFINESGHYFYKMGISPSNGDIFLTDAMDYQKKGYVLHYKKDGSIVSTLTADIIPGLFCFKN